MNSLHSLRTEFRSEWQMPQNRISICTSRSVGSRRLILVDASGDVSLAAEYAFALYVVGCMVDTRLLLSRIESIPLHATKLWSQSTRGHCACVGFCSATLELILIPSFKVR